MSHLLPHLLSLAVFAPAAGALAIALAGASPRRTRAAILASTIVPFVCALTLWIRFEPRGAEWQFVTQFDIVRAIGVRYALAVDGFGLTMVLLATFVAVTCAAWSSLAGEADEPRPVPWPSLLLIETGVLGALVSLDVLQFAVFWLTAMFAATAATGGAAHGLRPALRSLIPVLTAGALFAGAFVLLQTQYRALAGFSTFDLRALQTLPLSAPSQLVVFGAFAAAFAIPCLLAFRGGRIGSTALDRITLVFLMAILLELTTYGFIRFGMTVVPGAIRAVSVYAVVGCVAAALGAAIFCVRQPNHRGRVVVASAGVFALVLLSAFVRTPTAITASIVLQVVLALVTTTLLLAPAGRQSKEAVAVSIGFRELLPLGALVAAVAALAVRPAPLLSTVETSVARVVLRVSPEYAPQVADCLSQPTKPPDPAETGLPAGMVIAAPCADNK